MKPMTRDECVAEILFLVLNVNLVATAFYIIHFYFIFTSPHPFLHHLPWDQRAYFSTKIYHFFGKCTHKARVLQESKHVPHSFIRHERNDISNKKFAKQKMITCTHKTN